MMRALQRTERFCFDEETPLYHNLGQIGVGWNAAAVLWNGTQSLGWLVADNAIAHRSATKPLLDILALYALTLGTMLGQKRVQFALRESEARYRLLAENITDMVTRVDAAGLYVYLSPSTQALLGYEAQELIGKSSFELIHPDDIDNLIRRQGTASDPNAAMTPSTYRVRHKDGHYIWVETTGQVIWSDDKIELLGFITASRDITERKLAEVALQQALAKEKELNELKSRFVSMVAHDFRSPLATIQSSSDLLSNYSDRMTAEKKQHHFKTISGQIKFLTGILEDTLTISKTEAVGLSLHRLPTDFVPFCQSIIDDMQLIDETRLIRFTVSGEVGQVDIDRDHLRRALVNLLSNAAKYSPEGCAIEFSLSSKNEQVVIRIQDEGIGIPEADQTHLFEVFHRAGNVGDIPGTGLGLVIVKRAIETHGGSIAVESQVGLGTTFILSLPVTHAKSTQ
ncbi:MAG: PAS domain-containing sensor histidine kinase [Chloroflexota bacterium]